MSGEQPAAGSEDTARVATPADGEAGKPKVELERMSDEIEAFVLELKEEVITVIITTTSYR